MRAITVQDPAAGAAGLTPAEIDYPQATVHDVIVKVEAVGYTPGELDWPSTYADRAGHDRTPSVPGHDVVGTVVELGHGTTGFRAGQRVIGLADFTRDGGMAEYAAVEARNLAPLPDDVEATVAAALPIGGLTAWQGLFTHGCLTAGQRVLVGGAAGSVGAFAVQLARNAGATVIGSGRSHDEETARGFGADAFIDLENGRLEDAGPVDVVFDVIGGDILAASAAQVRPGGTVVTIAGPTDVEQPGGGRTVFFVVEANREQLGDLVQLLRDGVLAPSIGAVHTLSEAPTALRTPPARSGKTVISVTRQ